MPRRLSSFNWTPIFSLFLPTFQAQNPDELSIVESEQLEVVGEGDGDGWLRARNYRGEEGFVPQNYLDVEREPATATGLVSHGPGLVTQISFSSVDYTIDDHDAVDPGKSINLIINQIKQYIILSKLIQLIYHHHQHHHHHHHYHHHHQHHQTHIFTQPRMNHPHSLII